MLQLSMLLRDRAVLERPLLSHGRGVVWRSLLPCWKMLQLRVLFRD